MTINSTIRKAGPFIGNGTASSFPFTYKVFQASDLDVVRLDQSTNVETTLVLTTDYTVTLNQDQDSNPGGTVTLVAGPLAAGYTLTMTSDVPNLQPTDLTNQGGFYPEVINDALDRATIQIQQLQEQTDRSLRLPLSSTADAELPPSAPNELIGWDATGNNLINVDPSSLASVAAYATAYCDVFVGNGITTSWTLTRNPAVLYNLDVSINGSTQEPTRDYTLSGTTFTMTTPPPIGARVVVKYKEGLPNYEGDSQDVRFIQAGAGAVSRSVQSRLRESISIVDFGADPTGVASAVAKINLAQALGKTIYFPPGTYLIDSNLTISVPVIIDDSAKLNITAGTFAFGPGAIEQIKVEWFYTSGGYQSAFTKAFQVQRNSASSVVGMAYYGCVIPVSLEPNKAYVITGSITGNDYMLLEGNKASIQTSAAYPYDHSFPVITNIGYQPTIKDVTFLGGNNLLLFPENNQGYDIVITGCKFSDWHGTAILGSPIPHAQHLICKDCEFTARSVTAVICDIAWDKAVMKDCQYSGPSQTKFINRNNLVLEDWITSPMMPMGGESWSAPPRWIYNEGLTLEVSRFRFGGEPGAHRILQNESGMSIQGGATSISITNCAIYTGGDYGMVLNNMPANFVYRDNYGMIGGAPILYGGNSTGGVDGTQNIGRCKIDIDGGIYAGARSLYGSLSSVNSSSTMPRIAAAMNRDKRLGTKTIATADKLVDKTYGSMVGGVQPLFTVITDTDIFGATVQKIIGYDGDNTFNSYSYFGTTDLTGLPAGTYTLAVNITVGGNGGASNQGNPVSFGMVGALCEKFWNLTQGSHTLSMEFYWDGTNNPTIGYSVYNVDSSTYFAHNGFRLFKGSVDVTTWETITYGTAAPTSGDHRKGDRVIQRVPTIGQPKGWVCTASGTPGTWVSEGNL